MSEQYLDPFAQFLGIDITFESFEKSIAELSIQPQHLNVLGTVHGAVIFAIADASFARACNAGEDLFIGMQTEIRYMGQVKGKRLIATAKLIGGSKKLAHYQVEISDELGSNVAFFTATAFKLEKR